MCSAWLHRTDPTFTSVVNLHRLSCRSVSSSLWRTAAATCPAVRGLGPMRDAWLQRRDQRGRTPYQLHLPGKPCLCARMHCSSRACTALPAGRLFAAKMTQVSAANGGKFTIQWIPMAHGALLCCAVLSCACCVAPCCAALCCGALYSTADRCCAPAASVCARWSGTDSHLPACPSTAGENWKLQKLAERTKFSDIFETAPFNPATGCPLGFKSINADDVGAECLRLKVRCGWSAVHTWKWRRVAACQACQAAHNLLRAGQQGGSPAGMRPVQPALRNRRLSLAGLPSHDVQRGMETAATFLETRRYAAYLGATVEFSK